MKVTHVTLQPDVATPVKLLCKTGEILVKNFTTGDLLVSIEKEDFTDNYVVIPSLMGEVLSECSTHSSTRSYFFDDVYLKSSVGGEVEIRCLKV
jgi:hypothetical protein